MLSSARLYIAAAPLTGAPLSAARRQNASPARSSVRVRALSGSEGEEKTSVEDQFEKELRRRGLDPTSSVSEESLSSAAQAQRRSAFEQQQQRRTAPRPPPSFRGEPEEDEVPPQLAKSRALNAEGLEGLIPRATELLKLGVTFFLAFLPFIAVVSLAFGAIYFVMGESFVHGGAPTGPPPYYDPDVLLAEPTADPMVPLDLR